MVTDHRGSGEEDPLGGCHVLGLFPKTFDVSSDASNPNDFDHQLQFVHDHLKSMVFRSPEKLREQAKKVLDGSSKMGNSVITRDQGPMVNNEVLPIMAEVNPQEQRPKQARFSLNPNSGQPDVILKSTLNIKDLKDPEAFFNAYEQHSILPITAEVNLQERRPGLGRKRAQFSLNSKSSQPAVISEPTLNIKDLKDPEAFFKAYEQQEIGKREIQRLKGGVLTDSVQQNASLKKQPRRQGMLLDRRPAKYKHLYPSDDPNTNSNALSSQETFNSSIRSTDYHTAQESDHEVTSLETEFAGSLSEGMHEVDEILNELLSFNCEDLDNDRVVNVLQERLKLKTIKLEKLNLPDFNDIPKIDLKSAKSRLFPKPSHTLSDMDNMLKGLGLSLKTPMKHKQGSESSFHLVTSPTPPKSPFSPLSLLNQRILRSGSSKDPFSVDNIDGEFVSNSSQPSNKEFSDVGTQFDVESPLSEKDDCVEVDEILDVGTSVSHLPRADNMIDCSTYNVVVNDKLAVDDADGNAQANENNVQDEVQNTLQETVSPMQTSQNTMEPALDNCSKEHPVVEDTLQETVVPLQTSPNTTVPALDNGSREHAEAEDTLQETVVQMQTSLALDSGSKERSEVVEERPKTPLDKKHERASLLIKARKRGELDRRKSLSGAGTTCESGVRRSTRIKSRPLEYWKGERFLYGRIHKSLPTVIGLKYASPIAKGNKLGVLKVKSFVSDEHKELVELAARY